MTKEQESRLSAWLVCTLLLVGVMVIMLAFFARYTVDQFEEVREHQQADTIFRGKQLDMILEDLEHIDSHFQAGGNPGHPELDPGGATPVGTEEA